MQTILALTVVLTAEVLTACTSNWGRKMAIRNWSNRMLANKAFDTRK